MTNADKYFRNATDKELATMLFDTICRVCPPNGLEPCTDDCVECWNNWLKQEVQDG